MLKKFLQWAFQRELENHKRALEIEVRNEEYEKRRSYELAELQSFVGKPVICFSNEVQAPTIGFGERVEFITRAQNPVLIVSDYITYQEVMVMGQVREYTDQLLQAAFTVDPNVLIALLFKNYGGVEINKKPIGRMYSLGQALNILEARGFVERLQAYRDGRELAIPDGQRPERYPVVD